MLKGRSGKSRKEGDVCCCSIVRVPLRSGPTRPTQRRVYLRVRLSASAALTFLLIAVPGTVTGLVDLKPLLFFFLKKKKILSNLLAFLFFSLSVLSRTKLSY